jgi:hypothetical protein
VAIDEWTSEISQETSKETDSDTSFKSIRRKLECLLVLEEVKALG